MAGRGAWRGQSNSGGGRGSWAQGRGDAGGEGFWAAGRGDAGGAAWRALLPQPSPLVGAVHGVEHGFGAGRGGNGSGRPGSGAFVFRHFHQPPPIPPPGNFQAHPPPGFGALQSGRMGNDALGSHQYSRTSNNSPNQQGQGHAHSGFNSNQPGATSGPASAGNDGSQMTCYKCENPGHAGKDCQTVLFCANCAKYSHPSRECSFLSRPKPVASLVGNAVDGLQMFSARTGKKTEPDEDRDAIAIVTVKNANLTVSQLVSSLSMMFQWGEWEWMARPYIRDSFLVKFPSVEKIDEMKGFDSFRLIGTSADIKVVGRWTNSSAAAFKLYVCWVRITGVPETLEHYRGFCEAGSLIGSVLELDMELYGQSGVLRAKIGVMDPRKIPSSAPLNESGFIFNIHFELEDIVEEGGPMEGGILVSHPGGPESSHNITEKRPREQSNREDVGGSKSPRHDTGAVKKQKMREAEARVQRAKDKAALDEAARRRSDRHKNKDEGQTMDKATEMAKKKNLEMAPGG